MAEKGIEAADCWLKQQCREALAKGNKAYFIKEHMLARQLRFLFCYHCKTPTTSLSTITNSI